MKTVSIVMTPWNRTRLLEKTLDTIFAQRYPGLQVIVVEDRPSEFSTQALCMKHGIEYACRKDHTEGWTNPAPLLNHGIKRATGDIVIIQNAECKYDTETGIADLVAEIENDELSSSFAIVQNLDENGNSIGYLSHPTETGRAGWFSYFCQAVHRSQIMKIQGFDECFLKYGFEDDMFEFRLKQNGVKFKYAEKVLVSHQWHPRYQYTGIEQAGELLYHEKRKAVEEGRESNVANEGKEWGVIR